MRHDIFHRYLVERANYTTAREKHTASASVAGDVGSSSVSLTVSTNTNNATLRIWRRQESSRRPVQQLLPPLPLSSTILRSPKPEPIRRFWCPRYGIRTIKTALAAGYIPQERRREIILWILMAIRSIPPISGSSPIVLIQMMSLRGLALFQRPTLRLSRITITILGHRR